MNGPAARILAASEARERKAELARILVDCVEGGASISFMAPFGEAEAVRWWEGVFDAVGAGGTVLYGIEGADGHLAGSVQLGVDMPPNQPHRGDVKKLIVHRSARGRGFGRLLMEQLEADARQRGRTLLVLDTAGAEAERLYRRLGWTEAGVVPGYALWPDGRPCDTTFFWKRL